MTAPTGPDHTSSNYCYRHPRRQSFVLCQRCGRTICPECQTEAPVGVICPQCIADQRAQFKSQHGRFRGQRASRNFRARLFGNDSPVTFILIGVIAVVGLLQWITQRLGLPVIDTLAIYSPQYTDLQHNLPSGAVAFEPWRMLTAAFLHGSFLHFAMNALTLWIFGRALEPLLGSLRFLLLWVVSALAGSVAVALLAPNTWVVGASGAIFGLIGAWFVVLRKQREDVTPMLILIGINVVISLTNPGISWQAHLGGLLGGALIGWINLRDVGRSRKRSLDIWLTILVGAICVAIPPVAGVLMS